MPPRRTLTGKAAMASRRTEFLASHDRTQNGREAMAFRHAEFIAARDLTPMWEEFEDAKAECAVEQEAAKAAQRERKSQKALKKTADLSAAVRASSSFLRRRASLLWSAF